MRRSLPPSLKPFWAVDNVSEASRSYSVESSSYSEDHTGMAHPTLSPFLAADIPSVDLFYGILVSPCLLPCTRTMARVKRKMTTHKNSHLAL